MFLLVFRVLPAQTVFDTLELETVEITSRKVDVSGFKELSVDKKSISERLGKDLGELLSATSPVFIRSYVPGGLATASVRGASASHTQLLWNGLMINSPMDGQTDFSAIPLFFVDGVNILFGPASVKYSTGGLGGSVYLKTETNWRNRFSLDLLQEAGSFNTITTGAALKMGNERFQSSSRFFLVTSDNNYTYNDIVSGIEHSGKKERNNAAYNKKGFLQEFNWKASENTLASAKFWLQQNDREIPANILVVVPEGNENMDENQVRGIIHVGHKRAKSNLNLKAGLISSITNYKNQLAEIDADHKVFSVVSAIEYEYSGIRNLVLKIGGSMEYHQVKSENYASLKKRRSDDLHLLAKYFMGKRLTLTGSVRQDFIDQSMSPMVPAFGLHYRPSASSPIVLKASVTSNFRMPSLNDMYWIPGGNAELKSERGVSGEAGLVFQKEFTVTEVNAGINGFYSDINNWIIWQPDSIFSYWRPSNLKKVISKGIEINLDVSGKTVGFDWKCLVNYTLTSARNIKPKSVFDESAGKQLIYIPEHAGNLSLRLIKKTFTINYVLGYTGRRYTASDNSRYLPGFALQDVHFAKRIQVKRSDFQVQISVYNFANQQYQAVAWQPMPGRYFNISFKYSFVKDESRKVVNKSH